MLWAFTVLCVAQYSLQALYNIRRLIANTASCIFSFALHVLGIPCDDEGYKQKPPPSDVRRQSLESQDALSLPPKRPAPFAIEDYFVPQGQGPQFLPNKERPRVRWLHQQSKPDSPMYAQSKQQQSTQTHRRSTVSRPPSAMRPPKYSRSWESHAANSEPQRDALVVSNSASRSRPLAILDMDETLLHT